MMTMPARITEHLIDRLPPARGRYVAEAALSRFTWFQIGGPAEVLFTPEDEQDLAGFMAARPADVAVTVIGVGSNLLVRDGGVRGVVIRLGAGYGHIAIDGDTVRAGAMARDMVVAVEAAKAGLAGLEFLRGVPGSIGGAVRMNAGAYGREVVDVLIGVRAIDGQGELHAVETAELGMRYRHIDAPADWIFTEARLRAEPGDVDRIMWRMRAISAERGESQPVASRTGGSTFKNPPGAKAWELIDAAGCRGLRQGGAMVSEQHCNFLINTGAATAADLESLGEEVRRRVKDSSGIDLEWEIQRIGEPLPASGPVVEEVRP